MEAMTTSQALRALALAAVLTLPTGCYASVSSEPAYVETTYEPVQVYAHPSTQYDGRVVYLVDDRWYYRDGPSWYYYRTEPAPLVEHRVYLREHPTVVAPPPVRRHRHRHYAPPARRDNAPAYVVPRARRVR
jgi:hypothetical protein